MQRYSQARKAAKRRNIAVASLLPEVSADDFQKTLRNLCNISADPLQPAAPFPIEESIPVFISSKSEVDESFPGRTFVPRAERNPQYYEQTSWLFVVLQEHGLTIESSRNEVILDRALHLSFHILERWGMDHLGLHHFLSSSGHGDLAALVGCCRKINDICWLVKEAASRDKETALTYLPLSPFYDGVPDRSAGQRSSKYQDLLLAVKKPAYFELDAPDPETPLAASAKRSATERSPVKAVVVEANKASTSKKRKIAAPKKLQTSPQGLADHPSLPHPHSSMNSHESSDVLAPAPSQPLLQLAFPVTCTVEASIEQQTPLLASPPATSLSIAPSTPCAYSVLVATGILSSPEAVAVDLWFEVDNQVAFQIPTTAPSAGAFPSATPVQQNLAILQSMIMHDPRITYSTLKATIEKITEVLVFMGCPLEDWSGRLTLLLKFMKRQEFLAIELPCRLTTLETQRSEHEAVLLPLQGEMDHLHAVHDNSNAEIVALDNKAAQLKAELAVVEAKHQELTVSRAQHAEAVSSAESKVTSASSALKELQAQKESLEAMSDFPFVGILRL